MMKQSNRFLISIYCIPLLVATVLSLYFSTHVIILAKVFFKTGYYFMLVLFVAWIFLINKYLLSIHFSLWSFLTKHYVTLMVSFIFGVLIFYTIPPNLRILSDEAVLLGTSQSMALERTVTFPFAAKEYYNTMHNIYSEVPQRPLLFPFFVSIFHSFLGYHPNHVFWLNFFVFVSFIFIISILTRKYVDTMTSVSAIFLFLSSPVVLLSATSGGYDLFSALFLLIIFLNLFSFMNHPTHDQFLLLWIHCLLFSHIRYESILLFFIIFIGLLFFNYFKIEYFKKSPILLAFTPVFILPLVWQYFISKSRYNTFSDKPLFSFDHFYDHYLEMIQNQFNFDFILPYANLLHLLAIPILISLLFCLFKKIIILTKWQKHFYILLIVCLAVNLIIFLSHQWGIYTLGPQTRFFIIPAMILSLNPLLLKFIYPRFYSSLLLLFSIIIYSLYFPVAFEKKNQNSIHAFREYNIVMNFLKEHFPSKNILIITEKSGHFTVFNYGAIDFAIANRESNQLTTEIHRKLYKEVLVVQEIEFTTLKPTFKTTLDHKFELTTLLEVQHTESSFMRISKVLHPLI